MSAVELPHEEVLAFAGVVRLTSLSLSLMGHRALSLILSIYAFRSFVLSLWVDSPSHVWATIS